MSNTWRTSRDIQLSPEEEQKIGAQLGNILGFMEKLKTLDVSQRRANRPCGANGQRHPRR